MEKYYALLEFDKIRERLAELALSERAKKKALELILLETWAEVDSRLKETSDAKKIIESLGSPPVAIMYKVDYFLEISEKGAMLDPEQLFSVSGFLMTCGKMKSYLQKAQSNFIDLAFIGNTLDPLTDVSEEIQNAIRGTEVDDRASPELREIRKRLLISSDKIKDKLNSMLRGNKTWFADTYISTRNGRPTLPVKKEYKSRVPGTVIDISQTGGTCFIEPEQVRKIRDEMYMYEIEEENEIRRILYKLSGMVAASADAIKINIDAMEILDFMFAKAKLSLQMNANHAIVKDYRANEITVIDGRHPLLTKDAVPLQFEIGKEQINSVVITGPNTGGKTVALKTVGLLSVMIQCGLHVPASADSVFSMRDRILCDIGDGQSISENLSTFSSHMTNIIDILGPVSPHSLVLLDELGSGTDPAEGMGLAVAILEALSRKKCLCVATTHYPEIKEFAKSKKGFVNARMTFDKESLQPLYALEIGEAGESCALSIAGRLGMPAGILDRATVIANNSSGKFYSEDMFASSEVNETDDKFLHPTAESDVSNVNELPEKVGVIKRSQRFALGDSVIVYPGHDIGIVFSRADEKGMVGVIVKRKKMQINHKRLKLKVAAKELYPDDYDFSIVFDSVTVRKAHKAMSKHHVAGLIIHED